MTRIMRDSTNAADIPLAGLQLVAGYGTGLYTWKPADWARFGDMPKVKIDALGTDPAGCSVLDVENGDATPGAAPGWVRERQKALPRAYCTIYCNRANRGAVQQAMNNATPPLRIGLDYQLWIATLDGTEVLPDMTGVVAVQYQGEAQTKGHYDQSIVYDDAWHAPPAPQWLKDLEIRLQQISVAASNAAAIVKQHM